MSLLKRFFGTKAAPFAPLAPAHPICAIGDIHGRADLLAALLTSLDHHLVDVGRVDLVTVGDYVDRGGQSAAVLSLLQQRHLETSGTEKPLISLLGNHEAMMLAFLDEPETQGRRWLRNGGLQTLESFGIGGVTDTSQGESLTVAAEALRSAMPAGQEDWLRSLPTHWPSGNVHVVHAGADPTEPIADQPDATHVWGHPDFDTVRREDGQWVVHGHTITDMPGSDRQGRVAIDSGAYATHVLTAALIEPDSTITLAQTTRDGPVTFRAA